MFKLTDAEKDFMAVLNAGYVVYFASHDSMTQDDARWIARNVASILDVDFSRIGDHEKTVNKLADTAFKSIG